MRKWDRLVRRVGCPRRLNYRASGALANGRSGESSSSVSVSADSGQYATESPRQREPIRHAGSAFQRASVAPHLS